MRAPKLLPWVARKVGISDELAVKLWRRAAGEAEARVGCCDGPDYFRRAIERVSDLAEAESGVSLTPEALTQNRATWIWHYQERLSQLNLLAAQSAYRLWQSNWNNFIAGQRRAA
jgi:hypothetical protein